MVKQIRKGAIIIMIIAIIGVALNLLFGSNTVWYIEKYRVPNSYLWFYKYDFKTYVQNLNNTIGNTVPLEFSLPPHVWLDNGDITVLFANNMKVIGDYIILILNIILYPLRLGSYALINIFALIGIQTSNIEGSNINWLVVLVQSLYNSQIPYIP